MIRRFLRDKRGNFAMLTAIAIVPIMGALALAVDYAEMSRQRQDTMNALDAAGIATARRIVDGKTKPEMTDAELEAEIKTYAKDFFEANLGSVSPENATLTVVLPQNNSGGGTLKLSATLDYEPYFFPVFAKLLGTAEEDGTTELNFDASAEIRLKNTLEVALVLDNSGSMDELGSGTASETHRSTEGRSEAAHRNAVLAGRADEADRKARPVRARAVRRFGQCGPRI